MDFKVHESQNVSVVELFGEVDLFNAGMFRDVIKELKERNQFRTVINFERVPHMDSSGFGALIFAKRDFAAKGGDVKLLNVPAQLEHLFSLSGLNEYFEFFRSEEEAIAAFSQ